MFGQNEVRIGVAGIERHLGQGDAGLSGKGFCDIGCSGERGLQPHTRGEQQLRPVLAKYVMDYDG
jgi:hypothetical protein